MSRRARSPAPLLAAALLLSGCFAAADEPEPARQPISSPPSATPGAPPFPTPFLPSERTPTAAAIPSAAPASTQPSTPTPDGWEAIPTAAAPIPFGEQVTNILLLGSDRRSGTAFRDDVMILVSLDPAEERAVVLTIPRDLWVYLPGQGMQRINSAYVIGQERDYPGGGTGLLYEALSYNLGITADHFVRVEMEGFEALIDALGGVEVLVSCSYTDWRLESPDAPPGKRESWELFTVEAGRVRMDGDLALWYSRARARSSDFDRSRRQHEVLRALYRIAHEPGFLGHIPSMYQSLASHVSTDLTLSDVLRLGPLAASIEPASVQNRFIGQDQVENYRVPTSGAAVLIVKPEALRALMEVSFAPEPGPEVGPLAGLQVEVIDASQRPGWAELVAERLAYSGVKTTEITPAAQAFDRTLLVDTHPRGDPSAQAILDTLGLDGSRIREEPDPDSPVRFRLIVADDYNPCFDPTRRPPADG